MSPVGRMSGGAPPMSACGSPLTLNGSLAEAADNRLTILLTGAQLCMHVVCEGTCMPPPAMLRVLTRALHTVTVAAQDSMTSNTSCRMHLAVGAAAMAAAAWVKGSAAKAGRPVGCAALPSCRSTPPGSAQTRAAPHAAHRRSHVARRCHCCCNNSQESCRTRKKIMISAPPSRQGCTIAVCSYFEEQGQQCVKKSPADVQADEVRGPIWQTARVAAKCGG